MDYLPRLGGISNHIHFLNKTLRKLGIDARILQIIENAKDKHLKLEETEIDGNIVYRFFLKDPLKKLNKFRYRPYINEIIDKFGKFDVIHTHEFKTTEFLVPSCYYDRFVWTNHTSYFFKFFSEKTLKNLLLKPLILNQLKKAKFIITVSKLYEEKTRKILRNSNIVTIPNGIDIERFTKFEKKKLFGLPTSKIKILIPARWSRVKGIHIAVSLLKEMLKTKYASKLLFMFAGSDIYDDEKYRSKILKDLQGLENNYILLGKIEFSKMPYLYQESDIVLLPSLFENASITVLEAMASKKILIASNVGAVPEFVKDGITGFLFQKENVAELKKILEFCIENLRTSKMEEIKENAFNYCINNFSWNQIAKKTLKVYEKVSKNESLNI